MLECCIKRCLTKQQAVAALQRYGVDELFTALGEPGLRGLPG